MVEWHRFNSPVFGTPAYSELTKAQNLLSTIISSTPHWKKNLKTDLIRHEVL